MLLPENRDPLPQHLDPVSKHLDLLAEQLDPLQQPKKPMVFLGLKKKPKKPIGKAKNVPRPSYTFQVGAGERGRQRPVSQSVSH